MFHGLLEFVVGVAAAVKRRGPSDLEGTLGTVRVDLS